MLETIGEKKIINGKEYFSMGGTFNGFVYKNYDAFYHPEKYPENEIVYIPEHGYDLAEPINQDGEQFYCVEDCAAYTRKDFLDLFSDRFEKAQHKLAMVLFEEVDWQCPETRLYEWDEDDEAEILKAV